MAFNPDPKKYVIKIRRGKPLLVDRQILRWREGRKKISQKDTKRVDIVDSLKKKLFGE